MIFIDNYILIGNPVKHSISPMIHNTFFKDMGYTNKKYSLFLVEKLDKNIIDDFFNKNVKGLNVTVPYKIDIIKYLYKIDEQAKMIGAVNTLKYTQNGYIGYNTDIDGMQDTLKENNINIKDKVVLILGAGGSGYTASFMALKNKVKKIIIANRTIENAVKLKEHILKYYKNANVDIFSLDKVHCIENVNIIINTTTLGFGESIEKSPLDESFFKDKNIEFVFDIIYTPFKTKLLQIVEKNNIKYANGFSMLIYQALKAQEIWQDKGIDMLYKINIKNKILSNYKK
ncbi:shikimate dehydrogenase [uncultured Tyzzerella sp.]|uniref:shikimate dehydrogenase n=1 Tax=uncultured Tyzzerella sp. TaxID=2321398 RepID=UPI002941C931|nr:shikimate dehydrogenase [uncultured Tyzzerella sp.]